MGQWHSKKRTEGNQNYFHLCLGRALLIISEQAVLLNAFCLGARSAKCLSASRQILHGLKAIQDDAL
jgi:hypothetical protein